MSRTHRQEDLRCCGKIYCAKTKDCPRYTMPYVSSITRWLSSELLWKKCRLWGCRPTLVPTKPGPRALCHTIPFASEASVVQLSLCSRPAHGQHCALVGPAATERGSMHRYCQDRPLLSFDYISMGQGESRLSFKLSNFFLGSSWGYTGAFPYPILFLDLLGFHVFILSEPFPRLDSSPLGSPFWLLLYILIVLPCHLASIVHVSAEEFPPCCLSLLSVTQVKGLVVPQGDWKASPFSLLEGMEGHQSP